MKIIALIPARSRSKRIKNKNIKKLLGVPLINWTIRSALKTKQISKIFISTDDEKIINMCKKYNVIVPWKRPARLSGDKVNSTAVALHFLRWYEKKYSKPDGLLLLQPTSPFRKKETIKKAIKLFEKNKNKAIVSFSHLSKKKSQLIFYHNKKNNSASKPINSNNMIKLNGLIYLISPKNLRKYKSFFKPHVLPLMQNSIEETIDLDTHEDWQMAEKLKSK